MITEMERSGVVEFGKEAMVSIDHPKSLNSQSSRNKKGRQTYHYVERQ
jgi:hypothetical protein